MRGGRTMKSKPLRYLILLIVVIGVVTVGLFWINRNQKANKIDAEALKRSTQNQPKQGSDDNDVFIVAFGDFKCPYCGHFERNVKPEIDKSFIQNDKIEFRYVNVLLHGEESERGARAAHAVNNIAPEEYWHFHQKVFEAQPADKDEVGEKEWLTDDLITRLIDQLDVTETQKQKIINTYQDDEGKPAQQAKADHELAEKYNVPQVPALYINGKPIEDVANVDHVKKEIRDALS